MKDNRTESFIASSVIFFSLYSFSSATYKYKRIMSKKPSGYLQLFFNFSSTFLQLFSIFSFFLLLSLSGLLLIL